MPDYIVQEEDGTSRLTLEEGGDSLLLEQSTDVSIGPVGVFGPSLLAAAAVTIYTVPALTKTVIRSIRASNPAGGTNRTVTVSIGADSAATRIIGAETVPTGTDREWQGPWTLGAGEVIQAFASAASEVELTIDADVYVLGM